MQTSSIVVQLIKIVDVAIILTYEVVDRIVALILLIIATLIPLMVISVNGVKSVMVSIIV